MNEPDVPSPVDLCNPTDARQWESEAHRRPGRSEMFRLFSGALRGVGGPVTEVLELGSGPGFLAAFLLDELPGLRLSLLDYSAAMHDLARSRLGDCVDRVVFLQRNFRDVDWAQGLGTYDAVITNQTVHELRHKRYARDFHSQVAGVLRADGPYLVCDHFFGEGGMKNDRLFMSVDEQRLALVNAGFESVTMLGRHGGLVMHRASGRQ